MEPGTNQKKQGTMKEYTKESDNAQKVRFVLAECPHLTKGKKFVIQATGYQLMLQVIDFRGQMDKYDSFCKENFGAYATVPGAPVVLLLSGSLRHVPMEQSTIEETGDEIENAMREAARWYSDNYVMNQPQAVSN